MTAAKIAVAIPRDVLDLAKKEVKLGRAKSLSACISEAVDEKLRRDELERLLDAMDAEFGPPGKKGSEQGRNAGLMRSSVRWGPRSRLLGPVPAEDDEKHRFSRVWDHP
jgi:hypothetical protein